MRVANSQKNGDAFKNVQEQNKQTNDSERESDAYSLPNAYVHKIDKTACPALLFCGSVRPIYERKNCLLFVKASKRLQSR